MEWVIAALVMAVILLLVQNSVLRDRCTNQSSSIALLSEKDFKSSFKPYEYCVYYLIKLRKMRNRMVIQRSMMRFIYYAATAESMRKTFEKQLKLSFEEFYEWLKVSKRYPESAFTDIDYLSLNDIKEDEQRFKEAFESARKQL